MTTNQQYIKRRWGSQGLDSFLNPQDGVAPNLKLDVLRKKVDDLSKKTLDAEIGIANLQSETRELKNSDIEQNKEIRVVQAKADQNTQEIKENKEKTKQLETKITTWQEKTTKIWDKVFSKKETSHNIYDFDTYYHWIGWYVFVVSAGYIARKVYRIKTKKRKERKVKII